MFGIGWSEFVVIGVVALIAIGPKELPTVLRTVGFWVGKIRRMANEFQGQFQEALREAEMADVRKELEEISAQATDIKFDDPVAAMNKDIASAFEDKPAAATAAEPAPAAPTASVSAEALSHEALSQEALPQIGVPLPEPVSPVTSADVAPPAQPAKNPLPPEPDVPAPPEAPPKVASGGGS
ncbi:MAG: Twin-arginine translocation protein TatB [Pseudolabrys sp.]|jgi:sec-independent protein translocase protein TatB|nr:Twin-arginine translocation protein TatB [Pseudolabrys sp.]